MSKGCHQKQKHNHWTTWLCTWQMCRRSRLHLLLYLMLNSWSMRYRSTFPLMSMSLPIPFVAQILPSLSKDVTDACFSLRMNTSLGSDNVSPYFLKNGGDALHRAINVMFKICYRHGMMPDSWKHGHVVTIYKGDGDVNDANNYRPITITSVVVRAYERVNAPELIKMMVAKGIPSLDQFGFTRHRSTHDALYRLLSRIHEAIDGGTGTNKFCPAVFIDIS